MLCENYKSCEEIKITSMIITANFEKYPISRRLQAFHPSIIVNCVSIFSTSTRPVRLATPNDGKIFRCMKFSNGLAFRGWRVTRSGKINNKKNFLYVSQ